jgi:serine phosphatase RsbU (regulator of sigma subunit)
MRTSSLRVRLLGLVALVLLPWLALVIYTTADERRAAVGNVNRDAARLIAIITSNQSMQIESARQLLRALSQLPQLRTTDMTACNAFLAEMLIAYPLYLNIATASVDGDIRCSGVPMRSAVNITDRLYFRRAIDTARFAVGEYQIGRITRLPAINYAYPILGANDNVESVVIAAQSLSWLTAALARVDLPQDAVLIVTDANGTVLARLPDTPDAGTGMPMRERDVFMRLTEQREGGVFEHDDAGGIPRLWAHAPLISGMDLHATIGVPKSVAFAETNRRLAGKLTALAIATILASAAAWFGSEYFVLRQTRALVEATERLKSGDLAARANVVGRRRGELERLALDFNSMASTLEARDRELRIAEERTRAAEVELAVSRAQMEIAREIQRSLLPEEPLTVAGVRFAGRCIPAVAVGGDYFGYFPRDRTRVDSFIGDVSGHGVGAALLMAAARTTFLAERLSEPSAAPILSKLNTLLFDDLGKAQLFMTACCATFDARTRELSYANAGHPPPLLLRAHEGHPISLQADGMLLGIERHVAFSETKVRLDAGDVVVFYTDGITERTSERGEFFGVERLSLSIVEHRDVDPEMLIDGVLHALDRFAGSSPNDDDITIVAMKVAA